MVQSKQVVASRPPLIIRVTVPGSVANHMKSSFLQSCIGNTAERAAHMPSDLCREIEYSEVACVSAVALSLRETLRLLPAFSGQ